MNKLDIGLNLQLNMFIDQDIVLKIAKDKGQIYISKEDSINTCFVLCDWCGSTISGPLKPTEYIIEYKYSKPCWALNTSPRFSFHHKSYKDCKKAKSYWKEYDRILDLVTQKNGVYNMIEISMGIKKMSKEDLKLFSELNNY